MSSILGVPAQQMQSFNQTSFGAVVLSALSFYPELVSGSLDFLNCFLEILKRVQDKKDAAPITHATYNLLLTTYNIRPTTYNLQPTTFNLQHTTHNPQLT
jgi:hypothetical protein